MPQMMIAFLFFFNYGRFIGLLTNFRLRNMCRLIKQRNRTEPITQFTLKIYNKDVIEINYCPDNLTGNLLIQKKISMMQKISTSSVHRYTNYNLLETLKVKSHELKRKV